MGGRRERTKNLTRVLILKSTDLSFKRVRKEGRKILRVSILKRTKREREQRDGERRRFEEMISSGKSVVYISSVPRAFEKHWHLEWEIYPRHLTRSKGSIPLQIS